ATRPTAWPRSSGAWIPGCAPRVASAPPTGTPPIATTTCRRRSASGWRADCAVCWGSRSSQPVPGGQPLPLPVQGRVCIGDDDGSQGRGVLRQPAPKALLRVGGDDLDTVAAERIGQVRRDPAILDPEFCGGSGASGDGGAGI